MSFTLHRRLASAAALMVAPAAASPRPPGRPPPPAPPPPQIVRNGGIIDVNVAIKTTPGGPTHQHNTKVGATSASFPRRAPDRQYGQSVVAQLPAIGTRESRTSEPMSVDGDVVAVVDVHSVPWGDCSQSTIRVVAVSDPVPVPR